MTKLKGPEPRLKSLKERLVERANYDGAPN